MAEVSVRLKTLNKAEIDKFLKSQKDGVLSLTDGQSAYGVPLAYQYHDDKLYFGMDTGGKKFKFFSKCNNVSFTIYQTFQAPDDPLSRGWRSIILEGKLLQITDPEEIKSIVEMMDSQGLFPPGFKDKILAFILQNPHNSNIFKMKINNFGGREMPPHRREEEVVSVQSEG